MKPVPFIWVFRMKSLVDEGKHFMEKARCCLQVDRQLAYVDYDPLNVYVPVASHDLIRMILSTAANQNVLLEGADIWNAYLYGDQDISISMEQPTNSTQCEQMPGSACRINKSIYGTKQAGGIMVLYSTNH